MAKPTASAAAEAVRAMAELQQIVEGDVGARHGPFPGADTDHCHGLPDRELPARSSS